MSNGSKSYIYGIKDRKNDKFIYIGQTKREPKKRMNEHFKDIEHKTHKIKKLNEYKVEDLDFIILQKLNTDNSLLLSFAECLWNSKLKPLNRCVIQGFKGTVTLARCDKNIADKLINEIKEIV